VNDASSETRKLYEYEFVWFNAWLYAGSDCLWASLIQSLHLAVERRFGTAYTHAKLRAQFYGTLVLVAVSAVIVCIGVVYIRLSAFEGDRLTQQVEFVAGLLAIVGGVVASLYKTYLYISTTSISRSDEIHAEAPSHKDKLGYMNKIKEELKQITKQLENPGKLPTLWDYIFHPAVFEFVPREWLPGSATTSLLPSKIMIFVDDLDRCPPEKCVEVLQALVLLTEKTPFIIFLAIDPRVVVAAIESSHDTFYEKAGLNGHEYLEKIIQVIHIRRLVCFLSESMPLILISE
jgi:hypothetical protein